MSVRTALRIPAAVAAAAALSVAGLAGPALSTASAATTCGALPSGADAVSTVTVAGVEGTVCQITWTAVEIGAIWVPPTGVASVDFLAVGGGGGGGNIAYTDFLYAGPAAGGGGAGGQVALTTGVTGWKYTGYLIHVGNGGPNGSYDGLWGDGHDGYASFAQDRWSDAKPVQAEGGGGGTGGWQFSGLPAGDGGAFTASLLYPVTGVVSKAGGGSTTDSTTHDSNGRDATYWGAGGGAGAGGDGGNGTTTAGGAGGAGLAAITDTSLFKGASFTLAGGGGGGYLGASGSAAAGASGGGNGASASTGASPVTYTSATAGTDGTGGGGGGGLMLAAEGTSQPPANGGNGAVYARFLAPVSTTITSVAPAIGPTTGNTTIVVTGTKFTDASLITVGGVEPTSWSVDSDTQITAIVGPHAAGAVDVSVTAPGGSDTLTNGYTYGYGVSYSANGGTGTVPTDDTAYALDGTGAATAAAPGSVSRTGYQFAAWYTTPAWDYPNTKVYMPGDTFEVTGDTTLYAHWVGGPLEFRSTPLGSAITTFAFPDATNGQTKSATIYVRNVGVEKVMVSNVTPNGSGVNVTGGTCSTSGGYIQPYNSGATSDCTYAFSWTASNATPSMSFDFSVNYQLISSTLNLTGMVLQAGRIPTFSTPVATADGFTVNVTNWDTHWTWTPTVGAGSVVAGTPSGTTLPLTITGLASGATTSVSVVAARTGYVDGTANVEGTALQAMRVPTFSTPARTTDGFTVLVTNYDDSWSWTPSVSAGAVASGPMVGADLQLTVTGLAAGASATVTVEAARTSYVTGSADVTDAALNAARVPTFDTPVRTADGFTVNVTNYDDSWGWDFAVDSGSVSQGSPVGTSLPLTVTGLAAGASATVTVGTARNGWVSGSAGVEGTALEAAFVPTFSTPVSTVGGFTVYVTNYDDSWSWDFAVGAGSVVAGSPVGMSLPLTVTGLAAGASSTVTVGTTRTGYIAGSATVEGSASATPPATTPSAPSWVQVTVGSGSALVRVWAGAPNGVATTSYTVTLQGSNLRCTVLPGHSTCTIKGLPYRAKYVFLVVANGGTGHSAATAGSATMVSRTVKTAAYFGAMSSVLTPAMKARLAAFVKALPQGATMVNVDVLGYVQASADRANDASLSLARARAVAAYLTARGVHAGMIVHGKGILGVTPWSRAATVTLTYATQKANPLPT